MINSSQICTKAEYERFKSIHENLTELVKTQKNDDILKLSEILDSEFKDFWERISEIGLGFNINLSDKYPIIIALLEECPNPHHPSTYTNKWICSSENESLSNAIGEEYYKYEEKLKYIKDLIHTFDKLMLELHKLFPHEDNLINIDSKHFSNGKTWDLLTQIIGDAKRSGVTCEKPRTLRTLKERLKEASINYSQPEYQKLADSLKHKNGLAYTEIPYGTITILPKK